MDSVRPSDRYGLDMVNFRPTRQDEELLRRLIDATDRGPTYIIRRALRKITIEELMRPAQEEPEMVYAGEAENDGDN